MIDKTFDFANSEGTATSSGCHPTGADACTGGYVKQDWLQETCASTQTKITATYDKAAATGMPVVSNKSIVGVGSKGVLKGKGLVLASGVDNVIIQNIHITVSFHDLPPTTWLTTTSGSQPSVRLGWRRHQPPG